MPKVFTSKTQQIGELGENIACRFLMKHGFLIIERNYTKKWGEIDIIAEKNNKLHFIEVKSITHMPVPHETDNYRPEDNMHPWKLKRLRRTVQTYLLTKRGENRDWQFDFLVIYLNLENKKARIKTIADIVL